MTDNEPDPWTTIQEFAIAQSDVVSRRQLYGAGLTRWQLAAQLKAKRWQRLGDQAVCLHNGPVTDAQHHWAAVFQGGPRAKLDGAAALVAGGLERYAVDRLRVSVPRGAQARRTPKYDVRQTRRWDHADRMPTGVPRARPAPAAVRGALWAVSDRQATYLLTVTVQQGMATAEAVGVEALTVKRHKRRLLVHEVVSELLDGARSLGEIDVARELRSRGLPSPTRQAARKDDRGRYFLDLYWPEWRLVLEIDGIHHAWAEYVVSDALRQNSLAIAGDTVLRLPLLGLRLRPDDFFEQIEEALRANGWADAA